MTESNQRKKILFIIYPTFSHYISFFSIADDYRRKGYQVYLTGRKELRNEIENMRFDFVNLQYYESYRMVSASGKFFMFLKCCSRRYNRSRYKHFLEFKAGLEKLTIQEHFEKIFLDAHLSFYYCIIKDFSETVIVSSKLSTLKSPAVPPVSSVIVSRNNAWYRLLSNLLWLRIYLLNIIKKITRKIIFHGIDDLFFINRGLSRNGLAMGDLFLPSWKSLFYMELDLSKTRVTTLIAASRKLEYGWKRLDDFEQYTDLDTPVFYQDEENWRELMTFIKASKTAPLAKKLLYCSFGTITGNHRKIVTGFLKKIVSAVDSNPVYMLIIATGGLSLPFGSRGNIYVGKRLPQHNIMRDCDLVITHGGMNTIRDCLYFGKPMIVYPLNTLYDQNGNAARVAYHKLGLKGNVKTETIGGVLKKINKLLAT
jgi:UDP:flavonoid glycosyltransferase YjiC (YdhE family)